MCSRGFSGGRSTSSEFQLSIGGTRNWATKRWGILDIAGWLLRGHESFTVEQRGTLGGILWLKQRFSLSFSVPKASQLSASCCSRRLKVGNGSFIISVVFVHTSWIPQGIEDDIINLFWHTPSKYSTLCCKESTWFGWQFWSWVVFLLTDMIFQ